MSSSWSLTEKFSVTLEHGCDHGAAQCPWIHLVLAGLDEFRQSFHAAGLLRAGLHGQEPKLILTSQGDAVLLGLRRRLRGPGRDLSPCLVDLLSVGFLSIQGFALVNLHFRAPLYIAVNSCLLRELIGHSDLRRPPVVPGSALT